MQKKKKKTRLFIFLIICFVLVPFLLTKGCNYIESLNQAKNSVSEPITSISEQIQPSARVYTHAHTPARTHTHPHNAGAYAHERAHTRVHNAHVHAQTHSISKANWTGTAVPTSGEIGKVYFNKSLSDQEIYDTLNQLTFVSVPSLGTDSNYYVLAINEDMSKGIMIYKNNGPGYIGVNLFDNDTYTEIYFSNYGWWYHEDFIEVNVDSIQNMMGLQYNIDVAAQNELIKNVISITPFEDNSVNELSIGNLFTQLGNAIIIFGGAVVNVFISMEPIFWNEGPTLIFILLIASVSFALVFWGIELLISLIGVFKTKRKKKK